MSREQARADILAAASSTEVLGSTVLIDGVPRTAVKVGLSREEHQAYALAGLAVEGIRISIGLAELGWQPTVDSGLNVDGKNYTVAKSRLSGDLLKMTLTRNVG